MSLTPDAGESSTSAVMTAALAITPPDHPLTGRVTPPGSKSITNRALLLAALAKGTSRLTGALKSKDTALMAAALRQMGVVVDEPDATSFIVRSAGFLGAAGRTADAGQCRHGNALPDRGRGIGRWHGGGRRR